MKRLIPTAMFAATVALAGLPASAESPVHLRGEIDAKGFATAVSFLGEGGVLKAPLPDPERFIDRRYLTAAGVR